ASRHFAVANVLVTPVFNTSSLIGNPAGPFALGFVLTDGSGADDGNNTATLSSFSFGGGSAGPVVFAVGGASGGLVSSVILRDTSFFNELSASFSPGASLSFMLQLTTSLDAGATPDQFSFVLLRGDGTTVPTSDPTGVNSLITVDFDAATPGVAEFALAAVPEPSMFFPILGALVCVLVRVRLSRSFTYLVSG